MLAQFVQAGNSVDYTPTADVAAGAVVVQNDLVGVAPRAIAANTPGVLAVVGVWDLPKATGAGSAINAGVSAYWNAGASQVTATAAGNKLLGKSTRAAGDDDATVRVRLSQ